jgi:arylsulfatase
MSSRQPNVLWICTDQQRYDTIHALGNSVISTPNIDRLIAGGFAFTHAYCQSPICQPSRASFMTGLYPSTLHVNGNGVQTFPRNVPVVSKLFADAGYTCGLIGKLHLNAAGEGVETRVDDGYTTWEYSHTPHWRTDDPDHDYANWVKTKGFDLTELTADPAGILEDLHQTTWCGELTDSFIRENQDRPWFVNVNMFYPHPPFNPPREWIDRYNPDDMPGPAFRDSDLDNQKTLELIPYQREAKPPSDLAFGHRTGQTENHLGGRTDGQAAQAFYYALVSHIDEWVGRLIAVLEQTGQRENTIVLFMSDHGEMLGDHGLVYKGCRFYEGAVRVPMIWNWPGHTEQDVKADGLVELLDVVPTLLDLVGIEVPDYAQGRSLVSVLRGEESADRIRPFVRSEYYDAAGGRNREGKTGFGTMYRDERYKLVVYHGYDLGELYDLQNDPNEHENLWGDPDSMTIKMDLMKKSFDSSVMITDWGGFPNITRNNDGF